MIDREKYIRHIRRETYYDSLPNSSTSTIYSGLIPFYAIEWDKTIKELGGYLYTYERISFEEVKNYYALRSYPDLFFRLNGHISSTNNFIFSSKGEAVQVFPVKGGLFDAKGKPLFIGATSLPLINSGDNDKIFISVEFIQSPCYKQIYKKVYEKFILPAMLEGVEIITLPQNRIENIIYPPVIPSFNSFNSIEDYNKFLQEEVPSFLFKEAVIKFFPETEKISQKRIDTITRFMSTYGEVTEFIEGEFFGINPSISLEERYNRWEQLYNMNETTSNLTQLESNNEEEYQEGDEETAEDYFIEDVETAGDTPF